MTFMSSIRRPYFPPELIDAIIDASAHDKETLRSLAVVSKSCVSRCRKYLFKSIKFSTDCGEDILAKRHESFRSIIARDPRVPTYAHKLVIQDIEMSCAPSPWIITNTRFHETLHFLGPYIKRFTFTVEESEWTNFPASLKLAFMSIFTSPSLTFMRLQGLQDVPKACCVAFGSQVADLSIVSSSFTDTVDPDLDVVQEGSFIPQNLYWLSLEDIDEESIDILLDAWIPAANHDRPLFPCLTAINIGPTDEDALGPILELVRAGRETIQYFYWAAYDYGSQLTARPLNTQPLNLGILQKLFAIKYDVTFYPDDEDEAMPYPSGRFDGLTSLLQTVNPDTLQHLELKVDFRDFRDAVESLQRDDGWSDLNDILESESFDEIYNQFILQLDFAAPFSGDDVMMHFDTNRVATGKAEIETLLQARLPSLSTMSSYVIIFTVHRQRI